MIWLIYKLHNGCEWFLVDHSATKLTWAKDRHKGMQFGLEQNAIDFKQHKFGDDSVGIRMVVVNNDGTW